MTSRQITLDAFPEALREDVMKLAGNAVAALQQAARIAEAHIVEKSAEFADTSLFMQAWTVEDTPDGAILINDSPHASIIELGARQFSKWPPLLPLLEYLGRKRQVSTSGVSNSGQWNLADQAIFQENEALEELRKGAVLLAHKIKHNGIPPRHLLENAQTEFQDIVRETITQWLP